MFDTFRLVQARVAAAGDKVPGVLQHLCVCQLYLLCHPVWQPFLLLLPHGLPGLCAHQLVGESQSWPSPTFWQQLPALHMQLLPIAFSAALQILHATLNGMFIMLES